jgi:hypothetical protein
MTLLPQIVYVLCALTSGACMVLLLRGYSRTRMSLLLWSGLSFMAFTISNVLLFIDLAIVGPTYDLSLWRTIPTLAGVVLLLYGLIRTNSDL